MSNDSKIIELQKLIEEKEKELLALKKTPAWKTNASIVLNNVRYNLNVINQEECVNILSKLIVEKDALHKAKLLLSMPSNDTIYGFSYYDWEHDLKLRVGILHIKEKESKLNEMKKVLDSRLSDDAKAKKDIESIEKLISDF